MNDETNAEHKTLNGYIVANWKDESLKVRKTKPDARGQKPHEFAIPVAIEIIVPEVDIPELSATIEVPRPSVEANIRSEDAEHADPDGWQEAADETVEAVASNAETVRYDDVYEVVGRVLAGIETYPDPKDVEEYVHGKMVEYTGDSDE